MTFDAFAAGNEADLVYVNDAMPGITREREGDAWAYRHPDGTMIDDPAERRRIGAMRIPPAWTNVWISPIATGIQGRFEAESFTGATSPWAVRPG
jgi:DNA topoisomerase-1